MPAPRVSLNMLSPAVREKLGLQQSTFSLSHVERPQPASPPEVEKEKPSRKKKTLSTAEADHLVKSVTVSEDSNEVKFILAVEPGSIPTAQGKGAFVDKSGHVHFFTKPKQRQAEKAFEVALLPYAHLTQSWGSVPVELDFRLYFAYPESTPKKHRHKIGPHTVKPDGDNLIKGLVDSMTRAGFWPDDCFINTYHIYKRRTTGPACIVVKITNLQPKFDALFRDTEDHDKPTFFSNPSAKPAETNPLSDLFSHSPSKDL